MNLYPPADHPALTPWEQDFLRSIATRPYTFLSQKQKDIVARLHKKCPPAKTTVTSSPPPREPDPALPLYIEKPVRTAEDIAELIKGL